MASGDPRTLYVGNLSISVTEELLSHLFSAVGVVANCKMIYEPGQDPYCFVEFADHNSASQALATMNGREVMGKCMKVNWATSPNSKNNAQENTSRRVDTSDHFHIFCGDLSTEITSKQLNDAFSAFGEVSDCKVIVDLNTGRSKGYGFISFVNKEEAQKAINEMNGAWLGNRAIRTNWATRKPPAPADKPRHNRQAAKLNYQEVFAQTNETNCTVYCGGIQDGLSENLMRETFSPFGDVVEVRVFPEKGFAFVRFESKDSACNAIVNTNGQDVGGYSCRCSWGKETGSQNSQQRTGGYSQGFQQGAQGGYQPQYGAAQQWGQQAYGGGGQQWGGQWGGGDVNFQGGYQQGYDQSQYYGQWQQ